MSVDLLPQAAGSPRIGRYEVLGRLATGGMAEVYLACLRGPSSFEHAVVVKRILPHLADISDFTSMFLDEARIAASIRHPNVVRVSELSQDADGLYLVMEYLHGESLASLQRRLAVRQEPLSPALAAWIVAEACAGLHAAHELRDATGKPKELVHRDVSPDNLFLTYDGSVKVVDFGIAKAADRITKTEVGHIKGKFQYMSPEQCAGEAMDRRSDIFSAGIVLFEILTARRLFKRDSRMATWVAVTQEPIPRASSFVPDLPAEVERIVMRALSRDPEERYASALEMRRELLAFVRTAAGFELPEERLRALMHEVFADRVAEKNELLARMEEGRPVGALPPPETDVEVEMLSVVAPRASYAPATTVDARAPVGEDDATAPSRARVRVAAGIAAVLLAGGALALLTQREVAEPVVRPAAAPPVPAVGDMAEGEPDEVTLTIETEPAGAAILVDGAERGSSPLALRLPRGDGALRVVARAEGYEDAEASVVPEANLLVRLPLVATAAPEPAPVAPTRARRRRAPATPGTRFERFE